MAENIKSVAQNAERRAFTAREVRAAWVEACRLRTLPLAAAGSVIAAGIAVAYGAFRAEVFALMFITSVLLQVMANFADDYGDLASGLDDETRVGPRRGMQRGIITPAQMKRALVGLGLVTFAVGLVLIYVSFTGGPAMGEGALAAMAAFAALGLVAIAAAVLYTVGPHPYGYLGLGDIVSFIFFGLVAVVAGSFLYLHVVVFAALVAALALGLPVAAVMNVNNMRDSSADAAKGKRTIANRLLAVGGEQAMRRYHVALVAGSLALFAAALVMLRGGGGPAATVLRMVVLAAAAMPLARATRDVAVQPDHTKLDRFMAPTSMGTVLVAIAFSLLVAL